VSVAIKKLPAVEQVRVSLKDGLTILDLRQDNSATVEELRRIIKNSGFVSKEASVVARGTASQDGRTFTVSQTNERLTLQTPPEKSGDSWRMIVSAPKTR